MLFKLRSTNWKRGLVGGRSITENCLELVQTKFEVNKCWSGEEGFVLLSRKHDCCPSRGWYLIANSQVTGALFILPGTSHSQPFPKAKH